MKKTIIISFLLISSVYSDSLKMRDLYNKDMSFSSIAQVLNGKYISIDGFMATPLSAQS
jgi:hypothetical protein